MKSRCQNAHVRERKQEQGRAIRTGLSRALALSAAAHLLVLFLLRTAPGEQGRGIAAVPSVQVRLQQPPPPAPVQPQQPRQATPAKESGNPSAGRTRAAQIEKPARSRWMEAARRMARNAGEGGARLLVAPALATPGLGPPEPSRMPGLDAAFRPLPPTEICGAMLEFKFGIHDISMPIAYRCESRQEEFRSAPIEDRLRDALESND
ncbi:MAG TPA: hypothetical protein VF267_08100 [Gammaproteobacteria bacterium]